MARQVGSWHMKSGTLESCWKRISHDFHIEVEDLHAETRVKKSRYLKKSLKFLSLLEMSLLRIEGLIWIDIIDEIVLQCLHGDSCSSFFNGHLTAKKKPTAEKSRLKRMP